MIPPTRPRNVMKMKRSVNQAPARFGERPRRTDPAPPALAAAVRILSARPTVSIRIGVCQLLPNTEETGGTAGCEAGLPGETEGGRVARRHY